jgi:hypothetical protein
LHFAFGLAARACSGSLVGNPTNRARAKAWVRKTRVSWGVRHGAPKRAKCLWANLLALRAVGGHSGETPNSGLSQPKGFPRWNHAVIPLVAAWPR